jgi:hypothetical protein
MVLLCILVQIIYYNDNKVNTYDFSQSRYGIAVVRFIIKTKNLKLYWPGVKDSGWRRVYRLDSIMLVLLGIHAVSF